MTEEVLKDTITVAHRDASYTFRLPGLYDEMKVGLQMRAIRQHIGAGAVNIDANTLDYHTLTINRACATFDILLKSASEKWPYTAGENGMPVVDSSKFPPEKFEDVLAIYLAFETKLNTFRTGGDPGINPAGEEAVAG